MSMQDEINLARDTLFPLCWRVEVIDDDGGVAVTIFSGPNAKERAADYCYYISGGQLPAFPAA